MPEQMPEQSYAKHAKFVPLYHFVLSWLIFATFIGSCVNLYNSLGDHERIYNASLITAISVALMLLFFFTRTFPLAAQDRVIRAEENMRHYILTGKLLDRRLTVKQIVGLRFASDGEFPDLARLAAEKGMSQAEIKKLVKTWRADHDRL
jgi:hypothetical protein